MKLLTYFQWSCARYPCTKVSRILNQFGGETELEFNGVFQLISSQNLSGKRPGTPSIFNSAGDLISRLDLEISASRLD